MSPLTITCRQFYKKNVLDITHYNVFENDIFENIARCFGVNGLNIILDGITFPEFIRYLQMIKNHMDGEGSENHISWKTWVTYMMTSSNGNISALLAICAGNSPVAGEFPAQRPVTRCFGVFFDLRLNKRLSKQLWGWWFGTLSRPLWRHRNVHMQAECRPHGLFLCDIYNHVRTNKIDTFVLYLYCIKWFNKVMTKTVIQGAVSI